MGVRPTLRPLKRDVTMSAGFSLIRGTTATHRILGLITGLALAAPVWAQTADVEQDTRSDAAREALQQREGDVSQESNLEEVFTASEKQYSLLPRGRMSLYWSSDYSYYRNDTIDIAIDESSGSINRFRIENDAEHAFTTGLSVDYGLRDNLTFTASLPLMYKYDTQKDLSRAAMGDVVMGLRYQPFSVRPGGINTTLYSNFSSATGDSPYEINVNKDLSSGKGYYSISGGVSFSRIIDPVVLFGSVGYTMAFDATGLNQRRGTDVLKRVSPGDSVNFSMGLAYALSYEVSVSASYQQSYNMVSEFTFQRGNSRVRARSQDSTTSVLNTSLGLRTASNRIVNISFGFGLTEDSPDVLLGVSMPIDISGLKPGA